MTRRWHTRWDWSLTALVLLMLTLGLLALASAVRPLGDEGRQILLRQVIALVIGAGALTVCALLPPRFLERWAYAFYGLSLLLLIAVLLKGDVSHGARRWITLGGFRFQPSEPAKVSLILALAFFLSGRKKRWDRVWPWLQGLVLVLAPTLLVLRQPDLGTASVFPAVGVGMMVAAGLPALYLFLLVAPFLTALASLFWPLSALWIAVSSFVLSKRRLGIAVLVLYIVAQVGVAISAHEIIAHLEPYQRTRLQAFVNPEKDPQGAGYQVRQSKIAIGSGEWSGWGYGKGPLKALHYLPRQHTDFIYSVVGEEGGFLASGGTLVLFGLILYRGYRVARRARHPFVASVAAGVCLLLFYHATVNIAVTVGLLPVTGLPLPFYSYGGSFLISSLAAVGLLLGASLRKLES